MLIYGVGFHPCVQTVEFDLNPKSWGIKAVTVSGEAAVIYVDLECLNLYVKVWFLT